MTATTRGSYFYSSSPSNLADHWLSLLEPCSRSRPVRCVSDREKQPAQHMGKAPESHSLIGHVTMSCLKVLGVCVGVGVGVRRCLRSKVVNQDFEVNQLQVSYWHGSMLP